jgi:two-component system, sensor histidine kinase and response regulator
MDQVKYNGLNVLIVDDDPICIFIAKQSLKDYFNIDSVTNGYDAMEAIEQKQYHVILMDINLGDETMDGIRTMRNIRNIRKHRHTKIYAVTVYSNGKDWFLKQGFDGLFSKPVSDSQMIEEILTKLGITQAA